MARTLSEVPRAIKVRPCAFSFCEKVITSSFTWSVNNSRFPARYTCPSIVAFIPLPTILSKLLADLALNPLSFANSVIALAKGWLAFVSKPDKISREAFSEIPNVLISVTLGFPCVKVPVLSKVIVLIFEIFSRTCPPFRRTPLLAAAPIADTIVTGVEITKAHGQATTNNSNER